MLNPEVTVLLDRARSGDAEAFDRIVGQLYGELHAIARAQRRRLGASETVNTTAVVHEAYAKLGGRGDGSRPDFEDRTHFLRVASRAMRDVIVDYARSRRADKRGGNGRDASLDTVGPVADAGAFDPSEILSVDHALAELERLDPEAARIVELRYFAGFTVEETAEALDLSPSTVKRRWTMARAWLYQHLSDVPPPRRRAGRRSVRFGGLECRR